MILTDKQAREFVKWHRKMYGDTSKETWTWEIAVVYSDDPEKTEEEHKQMWMDKIKELLWKNANKKYTHRGWRTETYAEVQFNSLWLYCSPYFKSNKDRNAINSNTITWQETIWELWQWEWEECKTESIESST